MIVSNRKASFEYFFLMTFEAGIQLMGSEVKSIRAGKINLTDAYCVFNGNELMVKNLHISGYDQASYNNHVPLRERKLLLKRKELNKLQNKLKDKGLTIIPIKMYTSDRNFVKLQIALAKGKKLYDKRETLKTKDVQRELSRNID